MRQGEEYVPGTGALNVQLSSEETYAGAQSPPALLPVCCTRLHAACYLHDSVLPWTLHCQRGAIPTCTWHIIGK